MRQFGSNLFGFNLFFIIGSLLTACQVADAQRGFVTFSKHIIDETMVGGYGVDIADVDGDGLLDIVALATSSGRFDWYKNPSWQRFTITSHSERNIAMAPHDIDGDGDVDLVLVSEFSLGQPTEGGAIHWFENPGNPVQNQEWAGHLIDEIPTSHRIKWGDVNGDGKLELVNLPIIGIGAEAPLYDVNLELTAYPIPLNPSTEPWPSVVLDRSLQMAHGMQLVDWDNDNRTDILTASFQGVHLFQLGIQGTSVVKKQIGEGFTGERPGVGSSEVGMGTLGTGALFIASIEPWHGNEVVVYTPGRNSSSLWNRETIETEFVGGHALIVADLNNDGLDEIIAGHRSEPYNLYIYRFNNLDKEWRRIDLDIGGIGLAGLAVGDINGDGYMDIVGIGSGTRNVVYYENSGL